MPATANPDNPDTDGDGVADELNAVPNDAGTSDLASYLFTGERPGDQAGEVLVRGAEGELASFVIGVPQHDVGDKANAGAVYLVSASDLAQLDSVDGRSDRAIGLGHVATGANSWKFVGERAADEAGFSVASSGDLDGDGETDLLVGAPYHLPARSGAAYFVSGADFAAADAADGTADHVIEFAHVAGQARSWKFTGEAESDAAGYAVDAVPDADGDGAAEILIGAWSHSPTGRGRAGAVYLVSSGDLAAADAADDEADGQIRLGLAAHGASDRVVDLRHVAGQPGSWKVTDYDKPFGGWAGASVRWARGADGSAGRLIVGTAVVSTVDLASMDADDGLEDGVVDLQYVAARPNSWDIDTRQLTPIGDIDGDGGDDLLAARVHSHGLEAYLFSPSILPGVAAFWGSPPARRLRLLVLPDSPIAQFYPGMVEIAAAWRVGAVAASSAGDVDGDGLGDFLLGDPGLSVDRPAGMVFLAMSADLGTVDRVDGRTDSRLLLANFAGDADADGFPNPVDPDDDADGVADDEDAFPLDPAESADTDGDGVGNNADAFPSDLNEAHDNDGDGVGDNADPDDDNDGTLDADDQFPFDASASTDTDGDGVDDSRDAFPDDPAEGADADGDGIGDNGDADDDNDGVADALDLFPLNPSRSDLSSYRIVLDAADEGSETSATIAGDLDRDGSPEIVIASPRQPGLGIVYVISTAGLADADGADGVRDGSIEIEHALSQTGSWILRSGQLGHSGLLVSALGDINRDRIPELFIGARSYYSDAIILSGADLHAADAADGRVDRAIELWQVSWGPNSWRLQGHRLGDVPRMPVAYDMSGDNGPDLLIGQPGAGNGDLPGLVQVIPQYILRRLDRQDSVSPDGVVRLHLVGGLELWRLSGEAGGDEAGTSLAMDYFNADSRADLVVSAPGNDHGYENAGAVYILGSRSLWLADGVNGTFDSHIELGRVAAQPKSWKLVGGSAQAEVGRRLKVGDFNGDDHPDLVMSSRDSMRRPVVTIVSGAPANLSSLDAADGTADGVIEVNRAVTGNNASMVAEPEARSIASIDTLDFDGDGNDDVAIAYDGNSSTKVARIIAASSLFGGDEASSATPSSYRLHVPEALDRTTHVAVAGAGDLDADGLDDILLVVIPSTGASGESPGAAYIVMAGDLPYLDAADGEVDGAVVLSHVVRNRQAVSTLAN